MDEGRFWSPWRQRVPGLQLVSWNVNRQLVKGRIQPLPGRQSQRMFVWAKQKATDGRPQLQQEGWRGKGKAIKTLEGGMVKRKARIPWNSKAQGSSVPLCLGWPKERTPGFENSTGKARPPGRGGNKDDRVLRVVSNSRQIKTSGPLWMLLFPILMIRVVFLGTVPWTLFHFFLDKSCKLDDLEEREMPEGDCNLMWWRKVLTEEDKSPLID